MAQRIHTKLELVILKSSERFFLFIGKYSWAVITTAITNITHPVITKPEKRLNALC